MKDKGVFADKTFPMPNLSFDGNTVLFIDESAGVDSVHDGLLPLTGLLRYHTSGLDSGAEAGGYTFGGV